MKTFHILLAENRNPFFRVAIRPNAAPAEEFAAEELRRHLLDMAGVGPQLRNREKSRSTSDVSRIFVNDATAAEATGIDVAGLKLAPEAYHLRTCGKDVHILGGGPRGVLYGAYDLLETLGCRWFTPEISRIPRPGRIELPPLRRTEKPCFEFRDMFAWECSDPLWWARNRMNGWYTPVPEYMGGHVNYGLFVHTFDRLVPPEEFFDSHPEYFSEVEGVRRRNGSQLCLSNPEVLRILTDRLLKRMRENPRDRIWSVSQNDWTGYCECPKCKAVADEEGSQAGPILRFVNAVATETVKEFPENLIDTLAYWYSLDAPRKAVPHPNVRVRLCSIRCCQVHGYGTCDHKESARFMKALKGWSRITKQMYIWHYATNFANYPLPMPDYDELHANINLYRKKGVYGVFIQGMGEEGGGAETMALRGYVVSRLLWNPDRPVWPIIDEFLPAYYGRAANSVRGYLDAFHTRLRKDNSLHYTLYDPPTHPLFDESTLRKAESSLMKGEKLVKDKERLRVRLLLHGISYARLGRVSGRFSIRNGKYHGGATQKDRALLESMIEDWRTAGIQRIREGAAFDTTAGILRNRIGIHKVEWLSGGDNSIAVVPALGGRIIEWNAHGRQWISPADPDNAWNPYPMNEGFLDYVIQGQYGFHGWSEEFKCERRGNTIILRAEILGSLELLRKLSFQNCELRVNTQLTNRGTAPASCSLGPSLHLFVPGDFILSFKTEESSQSLDGKKMPDGFANPIILEGDKLPLGSWQVETDGFIVRHGFTGRIERAIPGRIKDKGIVALDLRTPSTDIGPNASLNFEQNITIESKR